MAGTVVPDHPRPQRGLRRPGVADQPPPAVAAHIVRSRAGRTPPRHPASADTASAPSRRTSSRILGTPGALPHHFGGAPAVLPRRNVAEPPAGKEPAMGQFMDVHA